MTHAQFLITLILVQLGLLGLLWLGAAALGLARRPALHWGATNLLAAASMSLVLLRGQGASPWLGLFLANLLGFAAYTVNHRGVQLFCGRPAAWRGHLLPLLAFATVMAWVVASDAPPWLYVALTSIALSALLLRGGLEALAGLRGELGRRTAWLCAAPMLLLGAMFAARAALSAGWPDQVARPLAEGGRVNLAVGLAALTSMLLLNLGHGAAVVIRTVALLRRLSDHDALTGLLNRRGLAALHERVRSRLLRGAPGYALLVVDLDHFKQVNDRHGHEVGDALLTAVGQALAQALRPGDGVARTGGEEFCVLLPDTDPAAAQAAGERLRLAVRAVAVSPGPGEQATVTCSIGVAWSADPHEPLADVARRADQALYQAKAAGRDRVAAITGPRVAGA